jgi:hypothetical protein
MEKVRAREGWMMLTTRNASVDQSSSRAPLIEVWGFLGPIGHMPPCTSSPHPLTPPCSQPFGSDLDSSEALADTLGRLLSEEHVYRIDHYLGKELVQNMLVLRCGPEVWTRGVDQGADL